jgi:nucleotide-binding universal stress UspA family protein
MTPLKTILAATDLSLDGHHAVHRAALLAHEHGARLHIVHVAAAVRGNRVRDGFSRPIDIDESSAQARVALRRCVVELAGRYDISVLVDVRIGDPLEVLLRVSDAVELLVVGHRGRGGIDAWRRGRFVKGLLEACRRPVLVVKAPPEGPYRRVLLPVDLSASGDTAVQVAARVARGAALHVFHAIDSHRESMLRRADVDESVIVEARAAEAAGMAARMRRSVVRLGLDSTRMSFAVRSGPALPATLHQARVLAPDLIVAGKRRRSTLADALLGSVSTRLLFASACDTLMVPAAPSEREDRPLPISLFRRGRTA